MTNTGGKNEHLHIVIGSEFGLNKLGEELRHTYLPMSRTLKQVLIVAVNHVMFKLTYLNDVCILTEDIRKKVKLYTEVDVKVYLETP